MSFPAQNARGIQNRKILEDLELKKQILLKTGAVPTPPTVSHPTTPVIRLPEGQGTSDSHFQRAQALQSAGFFITTDSAFGNSILPVLPRIEK
ncbi:SOSS complex subunit C homolog [Acyrthosiphon pisum]|uniref:SOSS complex subunit C homolog n=1 Tax=Acyrthosiphon pisum TaxID=7029 RepID=A0A8R2H752_ACYPI|nr:SOSS complex subunit C homolog [Acyrthosiphon pisum]|eukprot:XP_016661136.1 PREDICTED: SOSS complex subunit C homolog [Acyrthosiphon pisum]